MYSIAQDTATFRCTPNGVPRRESLDSLSRASQSVLRDRTRCGHVCHINGRVSMAAPHKRAWVSPEIRRYGTFEAATQGCDKTMGATDGFTFQGQAIVCSGS
jgi:hypothetical protein